MAKTRAQIFLRNLQHPILSDKFAALSDLNSKDKKSLRGDLVIVRTFGGKPAERRVWDTNDSLVYVTTDEEFAKLVAGKPALQPVGFPREDVFCRPAKKFTLKHINWSRLVRWPD